MIDLKIFNTESKKLESFKPIEPRKVRFYHCGPTVYWTQHIGNMRGMVMADLIRRVFIYAGYDVDFARNYTDVGHLSGDNEGDADTGEDRMEKAAKREKLDPQKIADKYIAEFERDSEALNILEPDFKPRATEYIGQMIDMVQTLLDKGFAYSTPQAVYFDVSKKEDYTKLSGQKLDLNKKGAGKGDVTDPDKKHPQDFAIWFFRTGVHKNALQYWKSPFKSPEVEDGVGFPGWHIECSAMSKAELGDTIDVHMGGIEHIPIHHTNEIAQSESANGVKFVNYWLHNEWLMLNGGKIAKSNPKLNVILQELIDKGYDSLALRYLFLNAHYRSKQNFTWPGLDASQKALQNLRKSVAELQQDGYKQGNILEVYRMKFVESLAEDFNVPQALALTWDLLKSDAAAEDKLETILDFDRVLGLELDKAPSPTQELDSQTKSEIEELVEQREQARKDKDWQKADAIREKLEKDFKITLKDTPDGVIWS